MSAGIYWAVERNAHCDVALHMFLSSSERDAWASKPAPRHSGHPRKRPSAFDVARSAVTEDEALGIMAGAPRTSPLARPVVHSHEPAMLLASA